MYWSMYLNLIKRNIPLELYTLTESLSSKRFVAIERINTMYFKIIIIIIISIMPKCI